MLAEVGLALVEEQHQVGCAVEVGKIPLLMLLVEVQHVRPFGTAALTALARRGLLLDGGHVGLQRCDLGRHVLELLEEIGDGWLDHGRLRGGCCRGRWWQRLVVVVRCGRSRWLIMGVKGLADL